MERFTVIALQPPLHLSFFFFSVMQAYFFLTRITFGINTRTLAQINTDI